MWSIDGTLTGTTTPGLSRCGSNGNESYSVENKKWIQKNVTDPRSSMTRSKNGACLKKRASVRRREILSVKQWPLRVKGPNSSAAAYRKPRVCLATRRLSQQ